LLLNLKIMILNHNMLVKLIFYNKVGKITYKERGYYELKRLYTGNNLFTKSRKENINGASASFIINLI